MKCRDVDNKKGIFLFSYFPIFLFSNCFPAKEEAGDACQIHQPGYQQAPRHAKGEGDQKEDEARRVELEIGDKSLAEDGKDGGEDVEHQAVAAQETDPPAPFRGSDSVDGQQGGNGEIGNQDTVQAGLSRPSREAGQQGEDHDRESRWPEECDEVPAALTKYGARKEVQSRGKRQDA